MSEPLPPIDAGLVLHACGDQYELTVMPGTPFRPRRFRLHKVGASDRHEHDVIMAFDGAVTCTCKAHEYRSRCKRGDCRHICGLREVGLLPRPEPAPVPDG